MQNDLSDTCIVKRVLQSNADAVRPEARKDGLHLAVSERRSYWIGIVRRMADGPAQVLVQRRLRGIRRRCIAAARYLKTESALRIGPGFVSSHALTNSLD